MAVYLSHIDPNAPAFKTVFKITSDQFNYSRNIPECCEFCGKQRTPSQTPFSLCTGCREARFCSKEHQIEGWPKHKPHCKERQKVHKQMKDKDIQGRDFHRAFGLPPSMERRRILEDTVEVHRHSIEQALVSAIHTRSPSVDLNREHVLFICSYRPESGGNPSTAFKLNNAVILPDPPNGSPNAASYQRFRATMVEPDTAMRREDPGYVGAFLTVFFFDNEFTWMTCTYLNIYNHDIPKYPMLNGTTLQDWVRVLQYFIEKGVVWRCVGPTVQFWVPGLMDKKGNKWIWTKRSIEDLRGRGINFTCNLRPGADIGN